MKYEDFVDRTIEKMDKFDSYNEGYASLLEPEKRLIDFLNFHGQVCNGGFRQWIDNGYGHSIPDLVHFLRSELKTTAALTAAGLIETLQPFVKTDEEPRGFMGDYWEGKEIVTETEWNECPECCGAGYFEEEDEETGDITKVRCDICEGQGEVEEEYEVEVKPEGCDVAEDLDDAYYDIMEDLKKDVEAYFEGKELKQVEPGDVPPPKRIPPKVRLTGGDGNAYYILGKCKRALQKAGYSSEECEQFIKEATSGDYDNLLGTAMKWCDVS